MFAKMIVLAALVTCVIAVPLGGHHDGHIEEHVPYHSPQYNYKYGVEDHHTGDMKSHQEYRDGDLVKGEYSFVQPDGKTRIVTYASDKHGGFHAYVTYFGGPDEEKGHL